MATATQSFQQRVGSVFGAVDSLAAEQSGERQPWQLQQSLVFREGADAASSDEEEDRAATDRQQALTESELLDMGNGNTDLLAASGAFCTALDREAEFDEADALAVQSSGNDTQHMPPRMLQVADGGAFHPSTMQQLPRSSADQPELGMVSALAVQGSERRSYVPDYVRRPDAYTCYELDEPLVVGGGDAAPVAAAQASGDGLRQNTDDPATAAALQASVAAMAGGDVAFRPRTGRGHQVRRVPVTAAEAQHPGPTALLDEDEDAAQEAEARQLHPAKRRQLRNKSDTS